MSRFYLGTTIAAALWAVAVPATAVAAEPLQSITASPTNQRLTVAAGSVTRGTFSVYNSGTTDYTFNVSAEPFGVKGEDYEQSFQLQPGASDVSKWFKFDATSYRAKAGQTIAVPYRLNVPGGVGPGGYYAVLFAQTQIPPKDGSGVTARKRVGVTYYLTVSGEAKQAGSVSSFTTNWFQANAPLEANLRLANTGNVHYDSSVLMRISDVFGNTKAEITDTKTVLPQTVRHIPLNWAQAPGFGVFKVAGSVTFLGRTEQLPAHYVLMLSPTAFVVIALIVVALGSYGYATRRRWGNVKRG